jgi:hypothetical protein
MKRRVIIGVILILSCAPLFAVPLEFHGGGGPSVAMLGEINAVIDRWNTLISYLNTTFSIHPDVSGEVPEIPRIGGGIAIQAGERYWLTDRLAVGGKIEYFRTSTSTAGSYLSSETSEIAVSFDCYAVSLLLGGRYTFLDAGVQLAADLNIGYAYSGFRRSVVFQIPPEHPYEISDLPPEGSGRYSDTGLGLETGLSLSVPITDWLGIGTSVAYRSLALDAVKTSAGIGLDLDGDGVNEQLGLNGITVQFSLFARIELFPTVKKE